MVEIFNSINKWYKGNVHAHTTISDGACSSEKCINFYKQAGYDFIAITDHRKYFQGFQKDDFLVLSGIELDINDQISKTIHHIIGIGMGKAFSQNREISPQEAIDVINKNEGIAIIAHPAGSLLTHHDILKLKGYRGIEIWNTTSEFISSRGNSSNYIDVISYKGTIPYVFAVDDTHHYTGDMFGGYIMVNSPTLSKNDITTNIKNGNFYSSQGPVITQITMDDNSVTVFTSPVAKISFYTDTLYCYDSIYKSEQGLITVGTYKLKPTDNYCRVECVDKDNKKAWSQFIIKK